MLLSWSQTAWRLACESGWRFPPYTGGLMPRRNETWRSRRTATAAQPHSDAISGSPNSSPSPGTHKIHSFCLFLRS